MTILVLSVIGAVCTSLQALGFKFLTEDIVSGNDALQSAIFVTSLLALSFISVSVALNALRFNLDQRTRTMIDQSLMQRASKSNQPTMDSQAENLDQVTAPLVYSLFNAIKLPIDLVLILHLSPLLLVILIPGIVSVLTNLLAYRLQDTELATLRSNWTETRDRFNLAFDFSILAQFGGTPLGRLLAEEYAKLKQNERVLNHAIFLRTLTITFASALLVPITLVAALIYGIEKFQEGVYSEGDLVMLFVLGLRSNISVTGLASSIAALLGTINRFNALFPDNSNDIETQRRTAGKIADTITPPQDPSFVGPSGSEKLKLVPGTTLAITGPNLNSLEDWLLSTLSHSTNGLYSLNHQGKNQTSTEARKASILYASPVRLDLTIAANIQAGVWRLTRTTDELSHALSEAGGDFVELMSNGLDTRVSTGTLYGTNLSGGQWQRLALARSFLQSPVDLEIYIDPTRYIDPLGVASIARTLEQRHTSGQESGLISVYITNSPVIHAFCDRVIVHHP